MTHTFGDPVTVNSRSTDSNERKGFFVRQQKRSKTNWVQVTDKKGRFWWAKSKNVTKGN